MVFVKLMINLLFDVVKVDFFVELDVLYTNYVKLEMDKHLVFKVVNYNDFEQLIENHLIS